MLSSLTKRIQSSSEVWQGSMKHRVFRCDSPSDMEDLMILLNAELDIVVFDTVDSQLSDLVKLENPHRTWTESGVNELIDKRLNGVSFDEYGVWIYYPWKKQLVRVLVEADFIRVRTIRNAYKISLEEQTLLRKKKIGVVGLSVGQSAAMTIAQERLCGEIRIADFDTIELSNLNRIRTPLSSIGLSKTTVVAREIAELDPFLNVVEFDKGITPENIEEFFDGNGGIDLLVEECDSIEIKILLRQEAKKRGIPVIMDTSDRGMLDIERYDVDSEYPIFHGYISSNVDYAFLKSLKTSEDKLPYIMPILGIDTISTAFKASGLEVGKSITTWPQLGSDVVLGGALCANTARRILLGKQIESGRYFIDLDALIPAKADGRIQEPDVFEGNLDRSLAEKMVQELGLDVYEEIPNGDLSKILDAAIKATSPGNSQRWLWHYRNGNLVLLIDKDREVGFADNFNFGTIVGLGCAIENLRLMANSLGYLCDLDFDSVKNHKRIAAIVRFTKVEESSIAVDPLVKHIDNRCCNRNSGEYKELSDDVAKQLTGVANSEVVSFTFTQDRTKIAQLSNLICRGDRIRLTNEYGHQDFFKNEIRWTRDESERMGDGLDVSLFNLSELDRLGLHLSKELDVIRRVNEVNGGRGFERISEKSLNDASAIGVVAIPSYSKLDLIQAGIITERVWLKATELDLGFQPYTVLQMLFSRLHSDELNYLTKKQLEEVHELKSEFDLLFPELNSLKSVFLFRINHASKPSHASARIPLIYKLLAK